MCVGQEMDSVAAHVNQAMCGRPWAGQFTFGEQGPAVGSGSSGTNMLARSGSRESILVGAAKEPTNSSRKWKKSLMRKKTKDPKDPKLSASPLQMRRRSLSHQMSMTHVENIHGNLVCDQSLRSLLCIVSLLRFCRALLAHLFFSHRCPPLPRCCAFQSIVLQMFNVLLFGRPDDITLE